ncbi:hypothetical protein DFH07DRAFT_850664 [Mycena maculata]|uniref:F-box domain-containing protein n=1 Tax=Mycena maculata TaxID=230809 RepID=A0AAD7HV89_9AGAR|nr:hypothetical protein DFH07DRAFT_850664 [Mycena maculata]
MTSPFASKLRTNYCPSDEEVAEIKALLVEPCLRLKGLDDKITALQKALDKLTQERDSLEAYVQAHTALISPSRRLPLDIIQEIFVACLPTHRNCVMDAREAPVLLGRLCSSWRAVSLSTPRLWASLHVVDVGRLAPVHDSSSRRLEERAALIPEVTRTWLGRSGQCPLSVSLYTFPFPSDPVAPTILETLIQVAPRWQHIQFTIPAAFLDTQFQLAAKDVPILKSIALHQYDPFQVPNLAWDRLEVLRGSNVTGVAISGCDLVLPRLPLRWTELTALSTLGSRDSPVSGERHISSQEAMELISKCPQLRTLSVLFEEHGLFAETEAHPIVHPLLQTFHCRGNVSTFTFLPGCLSLPELKEFTFLVHLPGSDAYMDDENGRPLVRFLAASSHLESLHIGISQFSSSFLQEILRSFPPTLQRLRINAMSKIMWGARLGSSLDDAILSVITPGLGDAAPCPCPALKELQIDRCTAISDSALLQFISARAATLKRIQVDFAREVELDIRPSLQPFIETGLDICITHVRPTRKVSAWEGLPHAERPLLD